MRANSDGHEGWSEATPGDVLECLCYLYTHADGRAGAVSGSGACGNACRIGGFRVRSGRLPRMGRFLRASVPGDKRRR